MKKILVLLSITSILYFSSCGSKENPYDREQKEMDKEISSSELQIYKSFKVALRGTAQTGKDSVFDQARMVLFTALSFSIANESDSVAHVDLLKRWSNSASFLSSVSTLTKTDEDSLPTVMENILLVMGNDPEVKNLLLPEWIPNESEEHGILGALWLGTPSAPSGLTLYELSKTNDTDLRSVDVKLISKMTRVIFYLQNKWPYHSEKSADEMVSLIEKEKTYLIKKPWPMIGPDGKLVTPEQAWHQLYAMSFLMRALARMEMDDQETEANADLESFVKEARQGGFDDKIIASSPIIKDKVAMVEILSDYFGKTLMYSQPVLKLKSSAAGRKFLQIRDLNFADVLSRSKKKVDSALKKLKDVF